MDKKVHKYWNKIKKKVKYKWSCKFFLRWGMKCAEKKTETFLVGKQKEHIHLNKKKSSNVYCYNTCIFLAIHALG